MASLRSTSVSVAIVLAILAVGTAAAAGERLPEYEVKAAFLYKLSLFVHWPESAFPDTGDPVVVGVLGRDPFGTVIDRTLEGKALRGRRLELRRYPRLEDLDFCHILFIGSRDRAHVRRALDRVKGKPILTIGEADDFVADGGVLQFLTKRGTVRFRIGAESARRTGLNISAKLLHLSE